MLLERVSFIRFVKLISSCKYAWVKSFILFRRFDNFRLLYLRKNMPLVRSTDFKLFLCTFVEETQLIDL